MIGFFGAIIIGFLSMFENFEMGLFLTTVLVLSGVGIGLFNITQKEKVPMMLATLVIGLGSAGLSVLPFIGGLFQAILETLSIVFVPTGIVIAFFVIMEKSR